MAEQKDNVVALHESKPSFAFVYRRARYTLSFDERYLYEEQNGFGGNTQKVHLLHRLSPKLREEYIGSQKATDQVRKGWLLLLGAAVIFFSEFRSQIPLLAPSLSVIGLLVLAYNIPKAWPRHWTKVCDDWDCLVSAIPHKEGDSDNQAGERAAFLDELAG
ncbi:MULTISPECIES: hypothetical protein [Halomonadaceae]|uniref:Uncharacterized protein n=1 Tax=Vreelandella halophila TaxID=86177 RepID=A0A9X4YE94_9GAMM|nr:MULTISPECIES: hypothetical protein [Halomonas]MYL28144.1 hypothetical protein [Halomonas utahensis]MYL75910.1 hypothetical protein [Halomonas sp. 22501_18_FS]